MTNEPVLTGSAATALAAIIVVVGNLTHLWTISSDTAVTLAGAVLTVVALVSGFLARRKVTPTAKLPAAPPSGP